MPQILIIADDLTGALDSAVAFAGGGRSVRVARRARDVADALAGAPDVLAVSTASREGTRAAAVAAVERVLAQVDPADVPVVIKKVDSRLKGHVGAETAALAARLGPGRAAAPVVALPAIPGMGRMQRGGRIEGPGLDRPLEIAPLLSGLQRDLIVPDVETEAGMAAAVAAVPGGPGQALWLGARGVAFALAEALFPGTSDPPLALGRSWLLAIGSRDPITLRQVAALPDDVPRHALPDGRMTEAPPRAPRLVLQLTDGGGARPGPAAGRDFAAAAAALATERRPEALLACGGETADAILEALEIGVLEVKAELAPGLPVCRARAPWGNLRIVTKSGGFGTPGTLRDILADEGARGGPDAREGVRQA